LSISQNYFKKTVKPRFSNLNYIMKSKAKPIHKEIGNKFKGLIIAMRLEEALRRLKEDYGIEINERKLQRYTKGGAAEKQIQKAAGRGKGKIADYPVLATMETYASTKVVESGVKFDDVVKIRSSILDLLQNKDKKIIIEDLRPFAVIGWLAMIDKAIQIELDKRGKVPDRYARFTQAPGNKISLELVDQIIIPEEKLIEEAERFKREQDKLKKQQAKLDKAKEIADAIE